MTARTRVLIVDDSAFARKVLTQILGSSAALDVVGTARDGLEALERIEALKPDVVTLDLMMPNLDGLGVLSAVQNRASPRFLVVSISEANSELSIEALQRGAVDIVQKPTALATDRLYDMSSELIAKVIMAAGARAPSTARHPPAPIPMPRGVARTEIIVIGTSTGGPQALTRLAAELPLDLPSPVAIALHIPAGYTEPLAKRLHDASKLDVVEASDGLDLHPGMVALAPGGMHLTVERTSAGARARVRTPDGASAYRPSLDLLFASAARAFGRRVLAVVLTGMGDDGLRGSQAVHEAGGQIIAEAQSSCIVYGMPRCVSEAGLADAEVSLSAMAAEIVRRA